MAIPGTSMPRGEIFLGGAVSDTQLPAGRPFDCAAMLQDIKGRIRTAQLKAVMSANRERILLYWDIDRMISERQKEQGWGAGVIPRLSRDIHNEPPD